MFVRFISFVHCSSLSNLAIVALVLIRILTMIPYTTKFEKIKCNTFHHLKKNYKSVSVISELHQSTQQTWQKIWLQQASFSFLHDRSAPVSINQAVWAHRCVDIKVEMKTESAWCNVCRTVGVIYAFLYSAALSTEPFAFVNYFNCVFKKYNISLSMILVHMFHI